jgi:FlaA1/EpsC-like NDP-sugar epimerase
VVTSLEIVDLLKKEQNISNLNTSTEYLQDKRVLVTGAGGDIGTELCRQILLANPESLILVSHGENSLYQTYTKLTNLYPKARLTPLQANIRNKDKLDRIVENNSPNIIFHAAANKHVPLSEINTDEAVLTNVVGTWNVLETASKYNIPDVVCISTDKAVEPCSIMGASKRIAELLVLGSFPEHHFTSVRFGNVLGSRGSVLPVFQEQIQRGGPVTVTDPEMTRYFMTRSEAVQLVLEAGHLDGQLFVLDMGDPIRIMDLAEQLIILSGHRPNVDIQIKITGKRPGEKMHESLYNDKEVAQETDNKRIQRIISPPIYGITKEWIDQVQGLCLRGELEEVKTLIFNKIN